MAYRWGVSVTEEDVPGRDEVGAESGGCVAAGGNVPLGRDDAEDAARVLKAVADPTRLQLLAMIRSSAAGEACVCDLTAPLGLRQPTVSHHLRVLTDAGLVSRERRGTWMWYSLVPEAVERMLEVLR